MYNNEISEWVTKYVFPKLKLFISLNNKKLSSSLDTPSSKCLKSDLIQFCDDVFLFLSTHVWGSHYNDHIILTGIIWLEEKKTFERTVLYFYRQICHMTSWTGLATQTCWLTSDSHPDLSCWLGLVPSVRRSITRSRQHMHPSGWWNSSGGNSSHWHACWY